MLQQNNIQIETQMIGTFWDFFEKNWNKRKFVIYGGAGSGKSVAVALHFVRMFMSKKDKVFLYVYWRYLCLLLFF